MQKIETNRARILAIGFMLDAALKLSDDMGDDALGAHISHARACASECLSALK